MVMRGRMPTVGVIASGGEGPVERPDTGAAVPAAAGAPVREREELYSRSVRQVTEAGGFRFTHKGRRLLTDRRFFCARRGDCPARRWPFWLGASATTVHPKKEEFPVYKTGDHTASSFCARARRLATLDTCQARAAYCRDLPLVERRGDGADGGRCLRLGSDRRMPGLAATSPPWFPIQSQGYTV